MKKLILLLVIAMFFSGQIFPQENKTCKVTLSISGDANDKTGFTTSEMIVNQRCYEFTAEEKLKEVLDNQKKYARPEPNPWKKVFSPITGGYNKAYIPIGDPSKKQDCAGYTLRRLRPEVEIFHIGAKNFYDQLISRYAKKISGIVVWGDVRAGDVLIYQGSGGQANHVTYVREVTNSASANSITVESKNENEGVFLHTITRFEKSDPLSQDNEFAVYRFPDNFKVEVKTRECKCEEIPKTPFLWFVRLNTILIDYKTKTNGFNGVKKMKIGTEATVNVEIQNIPKDPQKRYILEIWKEDANGRERLASVSINKNEDFGKLSAKYTTKREGDRTNIYGKLVEEIGGGSMVSDVAGIVDWEK